MHERVGRVVLVAAVFVTVLVRARSRQREFAAAEVTGDQVALASALRKIERANEPRGLFGSRYRRGREDDVPR